MRSTLLTIVLAALLVCVAAWTNEDHEIFRLRDEVELYEGEGTTFYDFVGVAPSASHAEINKAYRKKSAKIHPDKAERNFINQRAKESKSDVKKKPSQREIRRAIKDAQAKYQRLTVIRTLLTTDARKRYDHFLYNGFPKWRSSGYYYERFRPGLGSTLIGLWIFGGGVVHYAIMVLNHRQQKAFYERTIKRARKDAFGSDATAAGIPGLDNIGETATAKPPTPEPEDPDRPEPRNRKERRYMEKMQAKEKNGKTKKKPAKAVTPAVPADTPRIPKRRVLAADGRRVLLVANDGQVFVEQEDEDGNVEELLLDPAAVQQPSFSQTALVRAPFWIASFVQAKISGKKEEISE